MVVSAGYWFYFTVFPRVDMDLDKLQFRANVRSGWQALDLGFLMARNWWRVSFMAGAIPPLLLLILLLLFFFDNPVWAGFIVWWLKPFWERLPLFLASRNIFSEDVSDSDAFIELRKIYLKDWLPWLLWRRLSFYRAFDAPVSILEEQKGSARRQRLNTLHGKHTDTALANQFMCFCFEIILTLGLFLTVMFFIPDDLAGDLFDTYEDLTLFGEWTATLCAFSAMLLVMPFHTLAGFALYLNRRIELEAWDIEITFRSLAQRKQRQTNHLLASVLICCMVFSIASLPASSLAATEHDSESARQLIEQILDGKDFGEEQTVRKWRFKNIIEENEDRIPEWLIDLVEWWEENFELDAEDNTGNSIAFWIKMLLISCFVILLIYIFYRFRGPLQKLTSKKDQASAPDIMFGLDVRAESLPDDVPAQVMQLWKKEQHREALGLLYRAALSHLIAHHALAFKASHTEAECAALVKAHGIFELSQYFSQLTQLWRRLAYGHLIPDTGTLQTLCDSWPEVMTNESR